MLYALYTCGRCFDTTMYIETVSDKTVHCAYVIASSCKVNLHKRITIIYWKDPKQQEKPPHKTQKILCSPQKSVPFTERGAVKCADYCYWVSKKQKGSPYCRLHSSNMCNGSKTFGHCCFHYNYPEKKNLINSSSTSVVWNFHHTILTIKILSYIITK